VTTEFDIQDGEFIALNKKTIAKLMDERRSSQGKSGGCRRRVPRWPFLAPVQIWADNGAGEELEYSATCHDLNENGIGLYCERSFEVGVRVPLAIHQPEATYHGEGVIRHCAPSNGEYFLGVEFLEN
jgi:hypothetical protein